MAFFVDNFWLAFTATLLSSIPILLRFMLVRGKKGHGAFHRRTSLASLLGVDRDSMEKHMAMKQNIVNTLLCFEKGGAPSRKEMIAIMKKLTSRFERMRTQPRILPDGETCEWTPIKDLEAAIELAITEDTVEGDDGGDEAELERAILQKVEKYKTQILPTNPAWRIIVLKPSAVLVRIDHSIGDGLTLVTLLREIGTKPGGNEPLTLSDLSPLLKNFVNTGDFMIYLRPLKLLWLPNLWRAFSLLASATSGPEEDFNPLRPPEEHFMKVIPAEKYGTVYFPTVPLTLLKKLARSAGNGTTINDVVLFCLGDAIRQYFSKIDAEQYTSIRLVFPIGNPIRPSLYGDEFEGLCNHMTPVSVPLDISDYVRENPRNALNAIKKYIEKVKESNTPLLMTTMNSLFERIIPLDTVWSSTEEFFKRATCVYSNVPGPTSAISISNRTLKKIQVIMPHPTSIFQVLSYDGNVFCNITLDTRTAEKSWLLRAGFVQAIENFARAFGVSVDVQHEIDDLASSSEWGGNDVVYSCSVSK